MRYARARKDVNHAAIVAGLRAAGVSVVELHAVGGGVPDLLCGFRGWDALLEVKRPGWAKVTGPRQAATFARQRAFAEGWRGHQVTRVESLDEALAACGVRVAV